MTRISCKDIAPGAYQAMLGLVTDELHLATSGEFDEREMVDLTMAIVAINGWNRLAIAFHSPEAGSHVPGGGSR